MLIRPIACVVNYVTELNTFLKQASSAGLTRIQQIWLVTVLMGLIVTGAFNWSAFEKRSLRAFKESRLRWMFRHAKMPWGYFLRASVNCVLSHYNLKSGVLILDDSDKARSRNTSKIAGVHKVKDKKNRGLVSGSRICFSDSCHWHRDYAS